MKISVTKEDTIKGKRGSHASCPVALAIKRTLLSKQKRPDVSVGSQTFSVRIKGCYCRGFLPAKAIHFIDRFDSIKSVKPLTFTLDI